MTGIGAQPQPYDPQAIRDFLKKPDPEKHLVVRTSTKDGKKIKQFEYVETSQLTWKEKAQSLLGMGATPSKKIIKELVKQGLYREDLAKEVTARTHNKVGKVLERLFKPDDVKHVVAKQKNRDVMAQALEGAFRLGKDSAQNEIQHQLILNYLKMGTYFNLTADSTFYSHEKGMLVHSTPLAIACSQNWVDVVELLMGRALSSYNTKLGIQSSLMLNSMLRRPELTSEMIAALVIHRDQLYQKDDDGIIRMDKLMNHPDREGVKKILELLIDKGHLVIPDPNRAKEPPLFMRSPHDIVGEYLLEQAAEKAVPKTTPLILAIRLGDVDVVKTWCDRHPEAILIDRGRGGKSVFELAKTDAKDWRIEHYLHDVVINRIKKDPTLVSKLPNDILLQLRAFASEDRTVLALLNKVQDRRTLRLD